MKKLISLLVLLLPLTALAQQRDPMAPFNLFSDTWTARWISVPETGPQEYGVYHFCKEIVLEAVPARYVVHVTGDNRYKLYVNGTLVSAGPAKGDNLHWNYETVDLAPCLKPGTNRLQALVFHEGVQKPDSQISAASGFLLQGEGEAAGLYTDKSWKCYKDEAYSPLRAIVSGYYVAGPGERVDFSRMGGKWLEAVEGPAGKPMNVCDVQDFDTHLLRPSTLPQMERTQQRLASVRRSQGVTVPAGFLSGSAPLTVPAHTQAELLIDQEVLTNAYFNLHFKGGKGSRICLGYAEALYYPDPEWKYPTPEQLEQVAGQTWVHKLSARAKGKGNRNDIEGKVFIGREDMLLPDGQAHSWTTLSWRTYRYVRVLVETKAEPLVLEDLYGTFTGYPFTHDAFLDTDRQELRDMLDIGWRTARLCAWETYMDCPYYEQLQYLGDTRIQALITLYNSADDRLVRNFLHLSDISRSADGITKSRYPTTIPQHIQPYALCYIYALHDYMMYGKDTQFVMDLLPGAEQIMTYFSRFQQPDGRLKNLPGWNFSDWVNDRPDSWQSGVQLRGADGCSSVMDLQLLYACQLMAHMEEVKGNTYLAGEYKARAAVLSEGIRKAYWNAEKGLFANRAEQDAYSQHSNALAILCGIVEDPGALAQKLMEDASLAQCTIYYKFYLHEAYVKAGLGDHYLEWLGTWRDNMAMGLTTWGEDADVFGTRSDCHAWGASPNIELFRTVLGIDSDAVAFRKVKITPHLGEIKEIGGTMPHPAGLIHVHYKNAGKRLEAQISLPEGVNGRFVWKGVSYPLHGGDNTLTL